MPIVGWPAAHINEVVRTPAKQGVPVTAPAVVTGSGHRQMILGRYPCRHARLQSGDGSEPERASIGPIAIRPAQRGPVAVYREPKIVEVNPAGGICGLPGREVSTPAADMPAVGAEVRRMRGGMPEVNLLGYIASCV